MIVNHTSREMGNGVGLGGGMEGRRESIRSDNLFTQVLNEQSEKQSAIKRKERLVI